MTIKKRLILMFAPLIIILLALLTLYTQYTARKESVELAYTTALSIAADQSSGVMNRILNVESYLTSVAGEISEKITAGQITNRADLKNILFAVKKRETAPAFLGLGLLIPEFDGKNSSYVNTEEGNDKGQYAGYLVYDEAGNQTYSHINNFEEKNYFKPSYTTGKEYLTDAYASAIDGSLMVTFSAPIKSAGKVIGDIFVDISLNTLSKVIAEAKIPYHGGYAFLASNTGVIIGHPKKENLLKNLSQFNAVDKTKIVEELKSRNVIRESGVQSTGAAVLTLIYPFTVTLDPEGDPWYFGLILPNDEVMAESNANLYKTIGICVVGIVLALVITFLVAENIAKSVQRISNFSSEISKGNYDASVSTKGFTKELIALKDSLSAMVTSLLKTMQEATESKNAAEEGLKKAEIAMAEAQEAKDAAEASQQAIMEAAENIENVSSRLSAAAEELSAQVEESSRSAEQQREQVEVSVAAMEEMNSTILNVAENASSASEGSQKTKNRAEEGAVIVKDSISSIGQVESNIHVLQEEMQGLKTQAESIGSIMTVISDIADQTNLLALNAAIEAARAGEYGRGFAVVADEVRKLAEKTMSATGEVGQAVTGIQNRMERSVEALDVTTSNLTKSTDLVTKSGESLASIVDDALLSAGQISSIATAVEEQSASCQHISDSLSDINRISDEVATVMKESSQAVMDLSRQASELEDLVTHLRSGA